MASWPSRFTAATAPALVIVGIVCAVGAVLGAMVMEGGDKVAHVVQLAHREPGFAHGLARLGQQVLGHLLDEEVAEGGAA